MNSGPVINGPTPLSQHIVGRKWYKHTIHGTASVNGGYETPDSRWMTLFVMAFENRIADWHSVGGWYTQQYLWVSLRALRVALRGTPRCFGMIMARCGMAMT